MKRSKLFLASTAALLAVVGVFAAKAHKNAGATYFVTNGQGDGRCTRAAQGPSFTTSSNGTAVIGFTQYNSSACPGKPVFVTDID